MGLKDCNLNEVTLWRISIMEAKEGFAPCGKEVDDKQHERWRQEMSCCLIGCRSCKLYEGGKIFYEQSEQNMKKGLSIWAKHMLGRTGYE